MKKTILFFILILTITFSNLSLSIAQISEGGIPPSFINKVNDSLVDKRIIHDINLKKGIIEDSNRPGPLWTGRSIPVSLNMTNSGTWTNLPDGGRIWRLTLNAPGAKAISVCYDNFYIPEGGKLFLYNAIKTQVLGAYTNKINPVKKVFSTEIIQGESATLEYFDPGLSPGLSPVISISEIVYIYRPVPFVEQFSLQKSTQFGSSLPCEVNVNCSEGSNWQKEKRGVAEIFLKTGSSWGWCSGDLINTTNNSGIPYLITADHCHSEGGNTASASDMLLWQFYFNYESASCTNPSSKPKYNTLTGCVLEASSPIAGGSDFCLVLLNNTPPKSYNPYYNGWDRTNTQAKGGAGIHHPEADIKKISTFTSTLSSTRWYDGTNTGASNAHWQGIWAKTTDGFGQIEGGSSGSPLFNNNNLQIGTCTGSEAANCTSGSTFFYGKFYYHWDQAGTAKTQQLKPWLDPLGTDPLQVAGYDPNLSVPPVANFTATPTTSDCSGNIQFTDYSSNYPTSWEWVFGDGNKSTSQNPSHIYASSGSYDITLKATNSFGNNSVKKSSYVTINLPATPVAPGVSRCGPGSVNLVASGLGTMEWYDALTGGNLLFTGDSYFTQGLTSDKTYYVQSELSYPIQNVGPTTKSSTGGYYYGSNFSSKWALTFNVFRPIKLISVTVYANSTANRTIWLKNSSGVQLKSWVINIPSGQQIVTLNYDIPVGNGYQLGTNGQNNLWRDQGNAQYPYSIADLISITGNTSTSSDYYYYFYNWQVQPPSCFSPRTPVTATINPNISAGVSISANPPGKICSGTSVTFNAKAQNGGDNPSIQWLVNGFTVGTNDSKFVSSNLKNGDIVTCRLTSDAQCVIGSPALSNAVTMSVINIVSAPTVDINLPSNTEIDWNWNPVEGATGYKWNYTNDYNSSKDIGLNNTLKQSGLTNNTSYTIYVWAYNSCGMSNATAMTQSTMNPGNYSLTGKIIYDNIPGTPLNNVTIKIINKDGLAIDSAITSTDGAYRIDNISQGKFFVKCSTTEESSGFNPTDALLVNRFYIATIKFNDKLKERASDVNNDKNITPLDAFIINKRYVNAISSFPSGDWLFEMDTAKITIKNEILNIKALNYGDVDASKYGKKKLLNIPLNSKGIVNAELNQTINLPLKVDRNIDLAAFGIVMSYDINKMDITDVISNINDLVYNITDKEVRIAWAGNVNNLSLIQDETLLSLEMRVKTGNKIDLNLTGESVLVDNNFNEVSADILNAPKLTVDQSSGVFSYSCYPNPFKDESIILYFLPSTDNVSVRLLDILGREIETLVSAEQSAGSHKVIIDARNKQPGIYFYTINTKETCVIQRVIILK